MAKPAIKQKIDSTQQIKLYIFLVFMHSQMNHNIYAADKKQQQLHSRLHQCYSNYGSQPSTELRRFSHWVAKILTIYFEINEQKLGELKVVN